MRWLLPLAAILALAFGASVVDRNPIPLRVLHQQEPDGHNQAGGQEPESKDHKNAAKLPTSNPPLLSATQTNPSANPDASQNPQDETKWTDKVQAYMAVAIAGFTLVLAIVSGVQLSHIGATARAAMQANKLTRDIFVSTERPWVKVDIVVGGPLTYDVNGANITLTYRLTNVGSSPATNVWVHCKVVAPAPGVEMFKVEEHQMEVCNRVKTYTWLSPGYVIFPEDTIETTISVILMHPEIKRITQYVPFIMPTVVGCVDYGFVFETGRHQTGFIVDVRRTDRPRPEAIAKKRSPSSIWPDEGDISAADLSLSRSFVSGFQAD